MIIYVLFMILDRVFGAVNFDLLNTVTHPSQMQASAAVVKIKEEFPNVVIKQESNFECASSDAEFKAHCASLSSCKADVKSTLYIDFLLDDFGLFDMESLECDNTLTDTSTYLETSANKKRKFE